MSAASLAGGRAVRATARFRIKRGLDLRLEGVPQQQRIEDAATVSRVALVGADAPGVRAELRVAPGDRVRLGQALWVDRRRPAVRFTAPGAGVVTSIERGARRRLEAVEIALEGDAAEAFESFAPEALASLSRERLQALMLASGLWTGLRTRPFSRIPDPGTAPRSLFVTAVESEPLAPAAERIIAERSDDFARGVAALTRLTDGLVHVCTRPGAELPLPDLERVAIAEFSGPHPAGLPGTHIHCLDPAGPGRTVWHLPYPEVIALGRLLVEGRLPAERVVALTGSAFARPRLVRSRLGAATEELVHGELVREDCRILSGSVLSGRQATGSGAYLGRLHTQVCALPEEPRLRRRSWLAPGRRGRARRLPGGWGGAGAFTTSLGGRRGAFFPLERMERVAPLDLLAAPLLRALLVGNLDGAIELGCLELAEEDLALLTFLCPGKLEYAALLRAVLDEVEKLGEHGIT